MLGQKGFNMGIPSIRGATDEDWVNLVHTIPTLSLSISVYIYLSINTFTYVKMLFF